jgi:hypothetical protein
MIFIKLVVVVLLVGIGLDDGNAAAVVGKCVDCDPRVATVLRIGAFNIQTFGKTKMGKPHVAEKIKQVRQSKTHYRSYIHVVYVCAMPELLKIRQYLTIHT